MRFRAGVNQAMDAIILVRLKQLACLLCRLSAGPPTPCGSPLAAPTPASYTSQDSSFDELLKVQGRVSAQPGGSFSSTPQHGPGHQRWELASVIAHPNMHCLHAYYRHLLVLSALCL